MSESEINWAARPKGATHFWPKKTLPWHRLGEVLEVYNLEGEWSPYISQGSALPRFMEEAIPVPKEVDAWVEGERRMGQIGPNGNEGEHYEATRAAVKGYDSLYDVLRAAYDQASIGKGEERHANGKAFEDQPMQKLIDLYGVGFAHGQAAKKLQEAQGMLARGEIDRAIHEMLGAIVYSAGAIIHVKNQKEKANA